MVNENTCRRFYPFIPRSVLEMKQLQCDPLPPPSRVNEYDQEFFKGTEDVFTPARRSRRNQAADQRMMEQLVPDPVFRRQLEDFFNAHPHVAERFPGGVVQFAQAAAQLPEEVLEDILIAGVNEAGEGNNPMPGQMPGEEMELHFGDAADDNAPPPQENHRVQEVPEEESEEEEEEEEEEPVAPLPVRLVRNILGRFWGVRSTNANESSSDEEDHNNDVD
jgi:hypothetical protein